MVDLAEAWTKFTSDEQTALFGLLSERDGITLFQELDCPEQTRLVNTLKETTLPPKITQTLTRMLTTEQNDQQILEFPENSVGSWMHKQKVELSATLTSSQALEKIRTAERLRTGGGASGYYVTDKMSRVVGWVSLREMIAAPTKLKLSEYMHSVRVLHLTPTQDQEDAVHIFTKYQPSMVPVVDENDRFLGYLLARDILPLVQKEASEDIQKLAAVEALEDPYFETPFFDMVRKRALWLCVLFVGETLTATAMAFFEHEIARAVVLALFIPLIISSGGNSGSQAATLIVRAMALKEITFRDWWRVMRREFFSGAVLGLILGTIGFLRIVLWSMFTDIYGPHYLHVAAAVALALVLVVLWGSLSGSILPILLKRLGLDPAVVSAPFVATLVDVTGLVIYFSVSMVILRGTIL